ncbi:MAG: HlyD family efflux transporter periplasmic adaptor subunit [Chloroflexi bacterium]|nr:HlyD family efflux transporter periplasmic adaptor subunit [Chloroflexota bacterium]
MSPKRPPIPIIVLLVLVVLVGGWFLFQSYTDGGNGPLRASGTIEAVDVNIAPELPGLVSEVMVAEGDMVRSGDVLFRLDDTLLSAQREVAAAALDAARLGERTAQAALDSARAQYDLALDAARTAEARTRLDDWRVPAVSRFDQPNWYYTRREQIAAAQDEVDRANAALDEAQANLEIVLQDVDNARFLQVEQQLAEARRTYLVVQQVYSRSQMSDDSDLIDAADDVYTDAKEALDRAQQEYDDLLTTRAADDVLAARADVSVAYERYYTALDQLRALETGDFSPRVHAAQTTVAQAEAALQQAQVAVTQAEAQLALIDAQIEKLTRRAPVDGVVLTRSIQPGEVVQPGATAFVLARLENLTITVYVPEDRYGAIDLGQGAVVSVDSFPEATFTATVVYISDQAEFTPRNVQTVEGRSTTVYAVKLKVDDPTGKLKPGMPADVTFH